MLRCAPGKRRLSAGRAHGGRRRATGCGRSPWSTARSTGAWPSASAPCLDEVRAATPTVGALLALDADPAGVLDRAGTRAVLDAALAVRADELVAAAARAGRAAAIAAAHEAGDRWVVLDETAGTTQRTVEMHLASGLALVATADPYAGDEPYTLGEAVLDVTTGDPIADGDGGDVSFADAAAWRDARARRREEIDSRLDGGDTMLSDKR
ncbi:hypothetical protein [Actinomycetospora aeridis]|uniref:Uncharacterized protein n=1 Tax=Actinomycetospora aeridis TaxID=3129231 RepID=A0ABU8MYQ1_9PSEU